ncbi:MAG: response regulator, partial [Clostridium sp.]
MCTILHLEQSEFFLKMARNLIEERNCRYISASNIKEASSILRNNKVDIVITCLYPDGGNVEEFIKEVNGKYEVPIFVVTGNNIDSEKRELVNLGVTEYILKSNFEDEIVKHINYALKDDEYMSDIIESRIAIIEDSAFERA